MIRKFLLLSFTLGSALLFIFQLSVLQLFNSEYRERSLNNAVQARPVYPTRGLIYDRNGSLWVANKPVFDLMVVPENLNSFDTLELTKSLKISKKELLFQLQNAKRFSKKLPSVVLRELSMSEVAVFQEKMWKYPGFYFQKKSTRDYVLPIGANVLGYISETNQSEIKSKTDYDLGEMIGRQGIEKTYEKILRGTKGVQLFQKDRFNRIIGPYEGGASDKAPEAAEDITLTIDAVLQAYGESLMNNKRGGIVALEPQSGEVLALITAPNYNPNLLVGRDRSKFFKKLVKDTLAKPLFDRSLQAEYSPGSPFKTLNALIGLQEKVISPETVFNCNAGHFYARGSFMGCHCRVGSQSNLIKGIYNSCNTYFAKTFTRIIESQPTSEEGVRLWHSYLEKFGLGDYLGYDLPIGKPGFIPDSGFYNRWYPKGKWGATTIISNAIGQGEILTTPIQMANFTATIANRGYFRKPHFKKTKSQKESDSLYPKNPTSIDTEHFETVIKGMYQVVEQGTARIAKIKGIDVCGKTGTVENFILLNGEKTQLTDHSIFVAFAPKDDPKIALAVFIENGYWGGRWAAPIASLMIEKYLTGEVKRSWLENRMLEGSLQAEYEKPLLGKAFTINE
ncbi:penicillin-binding protein 2 [Flavobacteriaceae bacterium]|nr:penicillin-binding protein 2 [Flavobacteriaceae bacterium]MDA9851299.1 penicillin-binding protein 2 [Flavobacteriaceae bacterium]